MSRELLQQALDALEAALSDDQPYIERSKAAITALREALAAPQPKPVAYGMPRVDGLILDVITPEEHDSYAGEYTVPLCRCAAPAPVVPLTDEQIVRLAANYEERYHRWVFICVDELEQFARAVERAHAAVVTAAKDAEIERLRAEVAGLREQVSRVRMLLWDDFPECCGCLVVGAEYMGQQEMVCCGNDEPALLNDAQIVANLREEFPDAARRDTTPDSL